MKIKMIKVDKNTILPEGKFLAKNFEGDIAIVWKDADGDYIRGSWFGSCEGGYDYFDHITHFAIIEEDQTEEEK